MITEYDHSQLIDSQSNSSFCSVLYLNDFLSFFTKFSSLIITRMRLQIAAVCSKNQLN